MVEWLDNQKKQSSNLRKLLQQQIEKANPSHELTTEETYRLCKLEAIADKLKRGEHVQNRRLQTWLNEEEYEQLEYEWQEQLELREEHKDKPSDLKRYEEKLKQARFATIAQNATIAKASTLLLRSSTTKSENLCEDVLEILQEILHFDSSLHIWLDKDISFEVGGDLSTDIVSLPRWVTSRSNEELRDDRRLTSKQSVKLAVVERAMHNIGRDAAPASKPTASNLDKFLNTDD